MRMGEGGVYMQRFKRLSQFLWPRGERMLQARVLGCVGLMALTRLVTVAVPVIYKRLINSLTDTEQSKGVMPPR